MAGGSPSQTNLDFNVSRGIFAIRLLPALPECTDGYGTEGSGIGKTGEQRNAAESLIRRCTQSRAWPKTLGKWVCA